MGNITIVRGVLILLICLGVYGSPAISQTPTSVPFGRVTLHAHNCFPEDGRWTDRIDRALGTSVQPIAVEQDVVWYVDPATGTGRSVVAHGGTPTGKEPTLEDHFFKKVRPIIERALSENKRDTWPVVYLHFNFRDSDPAFMQDIWEILGHHEEWLTTAERRADESEIMPLKLGPLMALTENGQEEAFYQKVPVGSRLRVFGTMPAGRAPRARTEDREAQATAAVATSPEIVIPARATNYRRWMNFPWAVVERGGQPKAGEWTPADAARLHALVERAHAMGLWIRFYTLNGHTPEANQGWSDGYNFGSLAAARLRWKASIDASVDFLATDQYELLAKELKQAHR
ncbi:MAG: hypothetical protein ABI665_28820 [Vicinamibacterales bacterium]